MEKIHWLARCVYPFVKTRQGSTAVCQQNVSASYIARFTDSIGSDIQFTWDCFLEEFQKTKSISPGLCSLFRTCYGKCEDAWSSYSMKYDAEGNIVYERQQKGGQSSSSANHHRRTSPNESPDFGGAQSTRPTNFLPEKRSGYQSLSEGCMQCQGRSESRWDAPSSEMDPSLEVVNELKNE